VTGGFYGPLNLTYNVAPLHGRAASLPCGVYEDGILSDVAILNVPWAKAVRDSVKHGRWPLLNRFMLSGDVLLAAFQPSVFHPATLFGFLLPLAQAWTFGCASTFFLAGLCGFLFLRELGLSERAAFFGTSIWVFSAFMVFWVGWDIAPALAPFPLILFGLRRLARGARHGVGSLVVGLLLSLLAGHPETLLHEVALAGVYFLYELLRAPGRLRAVGLSIGGGMLALGLAAPALFPFLEAMPQTLEYAFRSSFYAHSKRSLDLGPSGMSALAAIYPTTFGSFWEPSHAAPPNFGETRGAFLGGLALALAVVGCCFSRRREKWIFLGLAAVSFLIGMRFPYVSDGVASLPLFRIALNERFAGMAAFFLAMLAAFGLESLGDAAPRSQRAMLLAVGVILLIGGDAVLGAIVPPGVDRAGFSLNLALLVSPIILIIPLTFIGQSRRIVETGALALFLLFHLAEMPRLYPTFPKRYFYPKIWEFELLPMANPPYRAAGIGFTMIPNQAALYDLEDPRGYTSMTNRRYWETFPLWSVQQPVWFNRIDDATRPFLGLLGVRFLISHPRASTPAGWSVFVRGGDCTIFENPRALPRVFAPKRVKFIRQNEDERTEMSACKDFAQMGWIVDDAEAGTIQENGPAKISITRAGTVLRVSVDALAPTWLIVTQVGWEGWHASTAAGGMALHVADHAFMGLRVPAGKSEVVLAYWPRSFTAGLIVFGVSLCIVVLLSVWSTTISKPASSPTTSP
jgi:hypothetical protein